MRSETFMSMETFNDTIGNRTLDLPTCSAVPQPTYSSSATRVSQLKIWHFWVIGIERNVCRCTFNRYSVIRQFATLAAGEQLCRRCTHRKLQHFKTFKSFFWQITNFEFWHCCRKWAVYIMHIKTPLRIKSGLHLQSVWRFTVPLVVNVS